MSATSKVRPCPTPRRGVILASYPTCQQLQAVSCKRWRCPTCGPRNAQTLRRRLEQIEANRFLTLTYHMVDHQSQADALRTIRLAWVHLRKQLCRRLAIDTLKYVAIIEWTKRGAPHIHILMQCEYVAQRWISTRWRQLTGSSIVDIRRVRSTDKAAKYLTNYLTKAQQMPPHQHKYSASRGYLPATPPRVYEPEDEIPTYSYLPTSMREALYEQEHDGLSTAYLTPDNILCWYPSPGQQPEHASSHDPPND